jgi:hypothetical protein
MKYLKVLLLAAVAVCAFGAASAQAALPEFGGSLPSAITSSSTTPSFENKGGTLIIKCATSKGKGEVAGAKTASFDELFEKCKATIFGIPVASCKSLTSTVAESILAKGKTTLGYALGTLTVLAALTIEEIHIECGSELIQVRGCVLALATPLALGSAGKLVMKGTKGVQEFTDYTTDAGATQGCKLESSLNGGAFEASDQVQTATLAFGKQVEIKD